MYIPEFACGFIAGAVIEMIILIIIAARRSKNKK